MSSSWSIVGGGDGFGMSSWAHSIGISWEPFRGAFHVFLGHPTLVMQDMADAVDDYAMFGGSRKDVLTRWRVLVTGYTVRTLERPSPESPCVENTVSVRRGLPSGLARGSSGRRFLVFSLD